MRTFNVTENGQVHVIRAHDFKRTGEVLSGKWAFVDLQDSVLYAWK